MKRSEASCVCASAPTRCGLISTRAPCSIQAGRPCRRLCALPPSCWPLVPPHPTRLKACVARSLSCHTCVCSCLWLCWRCLAIGVPVGYRNPLYDAAQGAIDTVGWSLHELVRLASIFYIRCLRCCIGTVVLDVAAYATTRSLCAHAAAARTAATAGTAAQ